MPEQLPTVSIVLLVFNRRDELRVSLQKMLHESDYPRELVDVIVVDNASTDGSAEMVADEFPEVQLIRRAENCGVSGINDGFAAATGEWVLGLDDDCYLPADGLRSAIAQARHHGADLVSFGVSTSERGDYRFDHQYRTGLLTYWGCAVLIRGEVLRELGGYDPNIFVWANELELMVRFFDRGYTHLHLPEIIAVHLKDVSGNPPWAETLGNRPYLINQRHFAYVAAKHLRARDAIGTLVALVAIAARHAILYNRAAAKGILPALKGFAHGARNRDPVRNAAVSRTYRRSFHSFASPWWFSRPPLQLVVAAPAALARRAAGRPHTQRHPGREEEYYARSARYYPTTASTLRM